MAPQQASKSHGAKCRYTALSKNASANQHQLRATNMAVLYKGTVAKTLTF